MAKTPETKAKDKIKAEIKRVCAERGFKSCLDWHAGTETLRTLDCTGVIAGHPVAIEVKRFDGRGRVTDLQLMKLQDFMDAGANTFLLDCDESLRAFVSWLETLEPRRYERPIALEWVSKNHA